MSLFKMDATCSNLFEQYRVSGLSCVLLETRMTSSTVNSAVNSDRSSRGLLPPRDKKHIVFSTGKPKRLCAYGFLKCTLQPFPLNVSLREVLVALVVCFGNQQKGTVQTSHIISPAGHDKCGLQNEATHMTWLVSYVLKTDYDWGGVSQHSWLDRWRSQSNSPITSLYPGKMVDGCNSIWHTSLHMPAVC